MYKLDHDFIKFIDPNYYADIISKNDEAGAILKLQLIAERFLGVYLDDRIPEEAKKFFKKGKSQEVLKYFDEKIMVSVAYGLPIPLADCLKCLNKKRNNFGHNFDYRLSVSDLQSYIAAVDIFNVDVGVPFLGGDNISETTVVSDGKKYTVQDGIVAGFVIATFCLMTRAGVWLVNDLKSRGQLRLEPVS